MSNTIILKDTCYHFDAYPIPGQKRFHTLSEIKELLNTLHNAPDGDRVLKHIYVGFSYNIGVGRGTVIDELASLLISKKLFVEAFPVREDEFKGGGFFYDPEKFISIISPRLADGSRPLDRCDFSGGHPVPPQKKWRMDTQEKHFLELQYDFTNGEPVTGLPVTVTFQNKSVKKGVLDSTGFIRFDNVPPGKITVEYGEPDHEEKVKKLRGELKTCLDNMVEEVAENSKRLDKELQKENLIGKGMVYTGAFLSGLYSSGKDIVTGVFHTMVAIQEFKDKILGTAVETIMDGNLDHIREEIGHLEAKGQYAFDQLQDSYNTLSILSDDPQTKEMVLSFPKRYFNELHSTEIAEMAGGLCTDILIGLLTGAAGAAIGKSKYFTKAQELINKLKKTLFKRKYAKKLTDRVDKRVTSTTEKFELKDIDKKDPIRQDKDAALNKGITEQDKAVDSKRAEPVDGVTGAVIVDQLDFTLPGRIPIEWKRSYSSQKLKMGSCGMGWQTPADARIEVDEKGVVTFYDGVSGGKVFATLPEDDPVLEEINGSVLSKGSDFYTVTLKGGLSYHFPHHFNELKASYLSEISDPSSNRIVFIRSGETLEQIVMDSNHIIDVYTESGLIRRMLFSENEKETPSQSLVEYAYSEQKDLIAVYDAFEVPYQFQYENHHLIKHTDREDLSFYYDYDLNTQKCIKSYGDKGLYNYTFEFYEGKTLVTNSLGVKETFHYNSQFLVTRVIDHKGNTTHYEYDPKGHLFSITDPLNRRTEYYHNRYGDLICLIRPDGKAITIEYNDFHKPIIIRDPSGKVYEQKWDEKGQLTESLSPTGRVTRYTYTPKGDLEETIAPNGATTQFETDLSGNITTVIDPNGQKTGIEIDERGNVAAITDSRGDTTHYEYDAKSRLTTILKPNEKTIQCQYDKADRLISFEDEVGNKTDFEYTAIDKVGLKKNPDGSTLSYEYDTEEQLIALINEKGERYGIQRDYAGHIVKETDYWGSSRHYTYDMAGQLFSTTNPLNETITYRYDVLGRLTEKLLPENRSEHFTYDDAGNLISHKNEHITVAREFDDENQLIKEIQGDQVITFDYDISGNRIERISPHGNHVTYAYDIMGAATGVTINKENTIAIERDAHGFPLKEVFSSGLTRTYAYDDEGRLTDQTVLIDNAPEITRRYEYDPLGNLTRREDKAKGVDQFFYNPLGRITRHIDPEERIREFLHDPCGNLSEERDKPIIGYRKTQFDGEMDIFDKAGRLKYRTRSDGRKQVLTWDSQDRLVHTRSEQNHIYQEGMSIIYDALGRRLRKKKFLKDTHFLWDGDTILSDHTDLKGTREFIFYPGTFEPLAVIDENKRILYYHNDHIGIPQEVTDNTGKIVWSAYYNTLGRIDRLFNNDFDNPIRMQGQYADDDIGLYYNRHRYYNPHTGTFICQDPLGLVAGTNVYQFAPNVWGWADPLGLDYTTYQIHSPGYNDVVQKGLHFYGSNGIELSVRPTHDSSITFTNSIPNEANDPRLEKAIKNAHKRFDSNEAFRKDIFEKAQEGKKSVIEHARNVKGSLRELAIGRSRELRDIERNILKINNKIQKTSCKK